MDDLRELYQATILEHNKSRETSAKLENATHEADGHNPLCGDSLTLYARVDEAGRVVDVAFQGSGCAISKASASLMTEAVKGKTIDEIETDFERFHALLTAPPGEIVLDRRARQARRLLRGARIPGAREVRDARLACAPGRARRRRGDGEDGVRTRRGIRPTTACPRRAPKSSGSIREGSVPC